MREGAGVSSVVDLSARLRKKEPHPERGPTRIENFMINLQRSNAKDFK